MLLADRNYRPCHKIVIAWRRIVAPLVATVLELTKSPGTTPSVGMFDLTMKTSLIFQITASDEAVRLASLVSCKVTMPTLMVRQSYQWNRLLFCRSWCCFAWLVGHHAFVAGRVLFVMTFATLVRIDANFCSEI
jgi:hypothetical protein